MQRAVFVTGGSGYIGSVMVPALVMADWQVVSFDREFFGRGAFEHPRLTRVHGDVRDEPALGAALRSRPFDAVIHLAAVSNDPGSDIDPELTRQINGLACANVMRLAKRAGIKRFLYASSASVYGIKTEPDVNESLALEPLTLYAKYKAEGEAVLRSLVSDDFVGVSVRSATVCGPSPRLRLDLTINILTHQAITKRKLTVFGGTQLRPNVHVADLADFYLALLTAPAAAVNGEAFNVSFSNASVRELADQVVRCVDPTIPIEVTPSNDLRSYSLTAARAQRVLGFTPRRTVTDAILELTAEYRAGRVPEPDAPKYRNVEWMRLHLPEWTRVESRG